MDGSSQWKFSNDHNLAHRCRERGPSTPSGHQFTSVAFTDLLKSHEIAISMDGKGAWRDNVFVERLWRTIKYEEVYLRAYESVPEVRASLGRYIDGVTSVKVV